MCSRCSVRDLHLQCILTTSVISLVVNEETVDVSDVPGDVDIDRYYPSFGCQGNDYFSL